MMFKELGDWTPLGLMAAAVGYLFSTRPTRNEITPRLKNLEDRLEWTVDTLFKMAQRDPDLKVVAPPRSRNGT